jgi:hypothetical protein
MGRGLEVITSFVTAPGATLTAAVACAGNSLQIRSADVKSRVLLINSWGFNQVEGTLRIRSPRLHDNVQGIRVRVPAAGVFPKWPGTISAGFGQFLIPQDTLIVEQSGSGVAGQIESSSQLVYYDSLPGISARLIDNPTLQRAGINLATVDTSITAVITGQYGGALALNAAANFQNLKANTDYALLGALVDARCTVVRILGVDFGNLGVGIPGEPTMEDVMSAWFVNNSLAMNLPLIPVFNSANAGSTTIDVQTNQAGGTFIVEIFCVELAPNTVPPAVSGPGV